MAVKVGSARSDENGKATGGKSGDQTGKEVSTQSWYKHSKGWRVFRCTDPVAAGRIADAMEAACANSAIGYDQNQRNTLFTQSKALNPPFWPGAVTTACETDCSALVRVCVAYAFGRDVIGYTFYTANEAEALLKSGVFEEMVGTQYTDKSDYLRRGDILCTKTKGHTVVVLSDGAKAGTVPADPATLQKGSKGTAVTDLQLKLMKLGYKLPKYGADGDFGTETEEAVKAFQKAAGLPATGIADKATLEALQTGQSRPATVTGGFYNVRDKASLDGHVISVAHPGDVVTLTGVVSGTWIQIQWGIGTAWMSEKAFK